MGAVLWLIAGGVSIGVLVSQTSGYWRESPSYWGSPGIGYFMWLLAGCLCLLNAFILVFLTAFKSRFITKDQ